MIGADGDIAGQVGQEIVLGADQAVGIFQAGVAPGLRVIRARRRRLGHAVAAEIDHAAALVYALKLMAHVGLEAELVAAVIERDGLLVRLAALAVDRGIAITSAQIDADAVLVVRAEASAEVELRTGLTVAAVVDRGARQRCVERPFRFHVDRAADAAAAGRYAVEERAGAAQHVEPADGIGVDHLPRDDAVEAAKGDVIAVERKAAQHEGLGEIAEAVGDAHGRIVGHHVGNGVGLMAGDVVLGVAGHREWRIHHILIAQHAQIAAAGDVTTAKGR